MSLSLSQDPEALFAQALEHHRAGRLGEATGAYLQVLSARPDLFAAHNNLGNIFCEQGRLEEAETSYRQALTVAPRSADAHNNLGTVLLEEDKLDEAIECFRQAIRLDPEYLVAHRNLASGLQRMGRLEEAEAALRGILTHHPRFAQAHDDLGTLLWEQGKLEEALASTGRAVSLAPSSTRALDNLGSMLRDVGRLDESLRIYQRLLQVAPQDSEGWAGYAAMLGARGEGAGALDAVMMALQIEESTRAKRIFADLARFPRWAKTTTQFRSAMVRALAEAWSRPNELAHTSAALVKQSHQTGACVARAAASWPKCLSSRELFGTGGEASLAEDELLCTLLLTAHNADIDLERFLTMARRTFLEAAANNDACDTGLSFYGALAYQCFLNDYVFFYDEDEYHRAEALRDELVGALATGSPVYWAGVLAVATYFPLHSLPGSSKLLDEAWPAPLAKVLTQQIAEPLEEARIRATIPKLTLIEREVSRRVRSQYEENPYPRWVRIPLAKKPNTVGGYLRQKFPFAAFDRKSPPEVAEILCACCGAGQMTLEIAQSLKSRVLGVDLSLKSLGYAKRKASELGISNIEFGHADVTELGSIGRTFDVVECSGALHYFADPFAGWRVLLSLLRPGGHMLLGLYSKLARRRVMALREQIAQWGYTGAADDIRRCREDLRNLGNSSDLLILNTYDFFGISTCRDLLFHVQEQQTDLSAIASFLKENELTFLGFEADRSVLEAYRRRYPDDPAATNLDHWQIFEKDNPEIFSRMYMFWVQSAAAA